MKKILGLNLAGLLALSAISLTGCGGSSGVGSSGTGRDSGGSIPIGKVIGAAEQLTTPVTVSVLFSDGTTQPVTLDSNGIFWLTNPPTDSATFTFTTLNENLANLTLTNVEVGSARFNNVVAAIMPAEYQPGYEMFHITTGTTTVTTLQLNVGDSVTLGVEPNGPGSISVNPTWVVSGGVGTIASNGTFTAVGRGKGAVYAIIGSQKVKLDVRVYGN